MAKNWLREGGRISSTNPYSADGLPQSNVWLLSEPAPTHWFQFSVKPRGRRRRGPERSQEQ